MNTSALHPQINTLFLDRDGTINKLLPGDYIRTWDAFEFLPGVLDIFPKLAERFNYIIIVTNQRGVGKGFMSEEDLLRIHRNMMAEIQSHGGRIDHIYYCTALDETNPFRKPNPGMALQAQTDFPDIDFSRSIMVGDSPSDEYFARNAGIQTCIMDTDNPIQLLNNILF